MKRSIVVIFTCIIEAIGCTKTNSLSISDSSQIATVSNNDLDEDSGVVIYDPFGKKLLNENSYFPLYAALPEDDFYLYGVIPDGMMLYHSGEGCYLNWQKITPRQIYPEMSYYDYDGDGEKELAVTIYWGSGTGISMMDLHILKLKTMEQGSWRKFYYDKYTISSECDGNNPSDIDRLLNEKFPMKLIDGGKSVEFTMDGQKYTVENEYYEHLNEAGLPQKIAYGGIVDFNINEDHSISVKIGLGLMYEHYASPEFFANVIADVNFDGEKFSFTNKRIEFD